MYFVCCKLRDIWTPFCSLKMIIKPNPYFLRSYHQWWYENDRDDVVFVEVDDLNDELHTQVHAQLFNYSYFDLKHWYKKYSCIWSFGCLNTCWKWNWWTNLWLQFRMGIKFSNQVGGTKCVGFYILYFSLSKSNIKVIQMLV